MMGIEGIKQSIDKGNVEISMQHKEIKKLINQLKYQKWINRNAINSKKMKISRIIN
jgi:hypothetical protein